MPLEDITQVC